MQTQEGIYPDCSCLGVQESTPAISITHQWQGFEHRHSTGTASGSQLCRHPQACRLGGLCPWIAAASHPETVSHAWRPSYLLSSNSCTATPLLQTHNLCFFTPSTSAAALGIAPFLLQRERTWPGWVPEMSMVNIHLPS